MEVCSQLSDNIVPLPYAPFLIMISHESDGAVIREQPGLTRTLKATSITGNTHVDDIDMSQRHGMSSAIRHLHDIKICRSLLAMQSGMDAAAKGAGRAGSWNPCNPDPAPAPLLNRILHRDSGFQLAQAPAWRSLSTRALDVGSIQQGTRLGYRLLLRNRGQSALVPSAHGGFAHVPDQVHSLLDTASGSAASLATVTSPCGKERAWESDCCSKIEFTSLMPLHPPC